MRKIVCLCGSTRFRKEYEEANRRYTDRGMIVLTVGGFEREGKEWGPGKKALLDELHLDKVASADIVHVLNVDGYVGESTAREVAWAVYLQKELTWYSRKKGEEWVMRERAKVGAMIRGFMERGRPEGNGLGAVKELDARRRMERGVGEHRLGAIITGGFLCAVCWEEIRECEGVWFGCPSFTAPAVNVCEGCVRAAIHLIHDANE